MNFLIITIDALSKWYIDTIKTKSSFFTYLEDNTYSFQNLFSMGPFTEAAVRGFWAGNMPLQGLSYLSESHFESDTFFETFSKTHYMYYGSLIPYYNYEMKTDNSNHREKCEYRAFEHIWTARLESYCTLYKNGNLNNDDYRKIILILDDFFNKYKQANSVNCEKCKYELGKKEYINEILEDGIYSSLYQTMDNKLLANCKYRNITCLKNQFQHEISKEEALFIKKAKNKNLQIALANQNNSLDTIENILNGEKNRCIISNNDLLSQMRDENEQLPKLKEEIDDFLQWYDESLDKKGRPFFAYIHNYDFHFPENFINSKYCDRENYNLEVIGLIDQLKDLNNNNISVSKQLSLKLIEKNLEYLWKELNDREIFKNTCVIITADHGISNFMNPAEKSNSRWNYTRTNFNTPLYIKAPNLISKKDYNLTCATGFKQYLIDINTKKTITDFDNYKENKDYIFTTWINGIPEIDRKPIKIGIRNNNWSITCEGFFYQTFSSLKILGIYNLIKDPDEVINIDYNVAIENDDFIKLFDSMGYEWYKQVIKLLWDDNIKKIYTGISKYQDTVSQFDNNISSNIKITRNQFDNIIQGKEIIVYGCNQATLEFLGQMPKKCELLEIWSDTSENEMRFYGHKLFNPHTIKKEVVIINCDQNELKFFQIVKKYNIKNYLSYLQVI